MNGESVISLVAFAVFSAASVYGKWNDVDVKAKPFVAVPRETVIGKDPDRVSGNSIYDTFGPLERRVYDVR